jgi:hypothetical protein
MLIKTNYCVKDEAKAICHVLRDKFYPSVIQGAEVGVLSGHNARNLLTLLNIERLFLVDPYKAYNDFDNQALLDQAKTKAHTDLESYNDLITWIELPSLDAVKLFAGKLHFAYLDNSHRYPDVIAEIPRWFSVLRMGGILCGDDFIRTGSMRDMEVFTAICEVASKNDIDVFISDGNYADWWLVKDRELLNLWI